MKHPDEILQAGHNNRLAYGLSMLVLFCAVVPLWTGVFMS